MPRPEACMKCGAGGLMRFGFSGLGSIHTGLTIFSAVQVARYVCPKCGFVEEWVEGKANLEKLRRAAGKSGTKPRAD